MLESVLSWTVFPNTILESSQFLTFFLVLKEDTLRLLSKKLSYDDTFSTKNFVKPS